MKKSFIFGAALMLAGAFGLQSCSQETNAGSAGSPTMDEATYDAQTLTFKAFIEKHAVDGVVTLPASAVFTMEEAIEFTEPLTITTDAKKPATIIAKAGFVVSKNFALENVNIDATELENNLVALPSTAADPTNKIEKIVFDNVIVKGLGKALFYSAAKGNLIADFTINNSVIEVAKDITAIDFTKGSSAANINVTNSTIYCSATSSKSMYSSQSGQKITELDTSGIQTFKFANNTIYNWAVAKNFFSHRQSNQKWLAYDVQGNIFVNCGKNGQVIKGMNGGQGGANPTWTIKGNVFNCDYDGQGNPLESRQDTSASETTGDNDEPVQESIAVVIAFADAEKGDFTQTQTTAGDPRWIANAQ